MRSNKAHILCIALLALAAMSGLGSAQQQARQAAHGGTARRARQRLRSASAGDFRVQESGAERPGTAARKSTITNAGCVTTSSREGGAPKLVGLFKRPTLVTGEPLNDDTVKSQIRNGSANMAAYKYVLNDADLNDLLSWLHDEKCCWNSDAPPLNPRYKGNAAAPAEQLYGITHRRPEGPGQERARRADRRHHGPADLGHDRDPHHRLQP